MKDVKLNQLLDRLIAVAEDLSMGRYGNYGDICSEKTLIEQALLAAGGNKTQAAERLGMSREGLRKKLKRLGIE
jgi:DNA-binding NtrC family response regulator